MQALHDVGSHISTEVAELMLDDLLDNPWRLMGNPIRKSIRRASFCRSSRKRLSTG